MKKFGRNVIKGHGTYPDGSPAKWKQTGVYEITNSQGLLSFIPWLTADRPTQDGERVFAIEKITIADNNLL